MTEHDLEKMRAFVGTGGVLTHHDAIDLLAEVGRLRAALRDIQADSGRCRVLEITREAIGG